ncbi:TrbC/VirB2 family protein [Rhizobium leguminosarum]|uniref:TrbC/VirB2 family protein n=1 Tax=Rhizobium leguminosarum TaxID=384 RepID=UPI00140F7B5C|nr:TrbC/VirB2 family protein [Rhizobium leguminosarum]QIO60668.1 hypothetical protein HA463_24425 [Rhizobium leguminosarum bv. trifolii]
MPKTNRGRVIFAGIVVVAAALLIPAVAGGVADPWGKFVSDFQTLITGLAAVGAATWTISVMEKTDARQGERHAQLIELSLRGDRLAVERAIYPQVEGLSGMCWQFAFLKTGMLKANTYRGQLSVIVQYARVVETCCRDLVALLEREQLVEGSRLFDGILAYKLHWLRETGREALSYVETFNTPRYTDARRILDDPDYYFRADRLYGKIINLADEIPNVVELLSATAKRYGLKS